MAPKTPGLHHVTAIAGDPQRNADFYVGTLGLQFVKKTVNHDDTGTYHFYFGDGLGTPGTNITFFPWTDQGRDGEFGAGQTSHTAYRIPADSVDYWCDRLEAHDVDVEETERFGETVLQFADPDGIGLELVASDDERAHGDPDETGAEIDVGDGTVAHGASVTTAWEEGPVPAEHQLQGFYNVTLAVDGIEPTAEILTDVLGYEREGKSETESEDRYRFRSATGGPGSIVDLVDTDAERGQMGVGTVHHVAFKARDREEQERWREAYAEYGLAPSPVIDRTYFESIYAREPGGVLFEMATMGPGFTEDETREELGSSLALPERLEAEREAIEAQLPAFDGPPVESEH